MIYHFMILVIAILMYVNIIIITFDYDLLLITDWQYDNYPFAYNAAQNAEKYFELCIIYI